MGLSAFFNSSIVSAPVANLPSTSTTYARWSAAETANGGLDGSGNWVSVDGSKTLLTVGSPFTYNATGLNNKPALISPQGNSGSFYLASVAMPNASAAVLVVMSTSTSDVQVVSEFSENVNSIPNTFANYIETNKVEAYIDINGVKDLYSTSQLSLNTPLVIASRYYSGPRSVTLSVNGVNAQNQYSNGLTSATGFGTHPLYVLSRYNNPQYSVRGKVAAYHLFHTAPTDTEWAAWIAYYKNLYQLAY